MRMAGWKGRLRWGGGTEKKMIKITDTVYVIYAKSIEFRGKTFVDINDDPGYS